MRAGGNSARPLPRRFFEDLAARFGLVLPHRSVDSGPAAPAAVGEPRTPGRREADRDPGKRTPERATVLANMGVARLEGDRFVWVNKRMEDLFGFETDELVGLSPEVLCASAGDFEKVRRAALPRPAEAATGVIECQMKRKDGSLVWVELFGKAVDAADDSKGSVWIVQDITRQRQAEEHLRLASTIFEITAEAILVSDSRNRIVMVNPAFTEITGYTQEEVAGQNPAILSSGRHGAEFYDSMWDALARSGRWEGEIWNRRKNGEVFPEWLSIAAVRGESDGTEYYVAAFSDITKRKRDEERISFQANYDALTEIPNRRLIQDRVDQALAQAAHTGERVGVLYLDMDNFKFVNDTMGHGVGDVVLGEMARRMRSCLRDRDAIGRMESDEFMVFLAAIGSAEETTMVARRLLEAVSRPMVLAGRRDDIVITASIGISVYPDDGDTTAKLVRNAATAAFHAKERGRNNYQFFTDDMNIRAMERLSLENRLRRAMEKGEMVLHYQPKVSLRHGRIVGMEALVRWNSPDEGLVPPGEFIPLAEETGLIVPLGEWVLRTACVQAKAWQDAGLAPLRMAVNLSARQLSKPDLLADVIRILDETGLAPEHLEMEITESSLMERADDAIATLEEMRAMGIHLTADDFGTGYASLNYLRNFPLDAIKIDRSFVSDIGGGRGASMLAAAVIAIGQSLDLKVTAEGVENEAQLAFLRQHWCDEIQGSYFSPPLPAAEFEVLVREGRRL